MSTIEVFNCIQDTPPGPQGVHNRGVPLYTCINPQMVLYLSPSFLSDTEPLAEFKSAVRQTSMKRQETILEQEGRLDPPSLASLSFTRPSISLGRPSVSSQGRPSVSSQGRPSLTPPSSLSRSLAPPKPLRNLMSRVTLEDIPLAAHPTPFPGREGFPTLSSGPLTVEEVGGARGGARGVAL